MSVVQQGGRLLAAALLLWGQSGQGELVNVEAPRPPRPGQRGEPRATAKTNAPPPAVAARSEDVLHLLNGDRLLGCLVGVDGVGGLLAWRHKAVRDPLHFQITALDKVDLRPRQGGGLQRHKQSVQLVNGDRLCGDVVTLDATQLVLKTWYAGTLNIARSRLSELTPTAGSTDVFYEGPDSDLKGWSLAEGEQGAALVFRKGALVLPAGRSVGRKLADLPDKVHFELELTGWHNAGLMFCFFCKNPQSPEGEAYGLHLMGGHVELMRNATDGDTRSLGAVDLEEQLAARRRLQMTLLADRKERRFMLLLNGRLVHEFRDQQEFKGGGHSLILQAMDMAGLRICKIKVARWDGRLPKLEAADVPGEQDTVVLNNGDTIAGKVLGIAQDKARFETSYGALEIPLSRIGRLRFAGPPSAVAKNGTRCFFNEQEALTLQIEKLADETITGMAAGVGMLKLPLGAFVALEFNPDVKRDSADDDEL